MKRNENYPFELVYKGEYYNQNLLDVFSINSYVYGYEMNFFYHIWTS